MTVRINALLRNLVPIYVFIVPRDPTWNTLRLLQRGSLEVTPTGLPLCIAADTEGPRASNPPRQSHLVRPAIIVLQLSVQSPRNRGTVAPLSDDPTVSLPA